MRYIKALFFLVAFFTFVFRSGAQEWKVYKCYDGDFSVLTPAPMEDKASEILTETGTIQLHTLFLHQKDTLSDFLYLVNYYDLEQDLIPKDSLALKKLFLRESMEQSVLDINGEVQYFNEISMGAHPGLLWRAQYEGGAVKSRAYLLDNRFVMLQVFMDQRNALSDNVDRFLESFTVIPK